MEFSEICGLRDKIKHNSQSKVELFESKPIELMCSINLTRYFWPKQDGNKVEKSREKWQKKWSNA